MSINRDLPFSRWKLRPEQGEPSYSYFARLVADEGHSSTKVYATEIGINGRNIVPEEMLETLMRLPLLDEDRSRLQQATPVLEDGFYRIGNERVRAKHLLFRHRHFCRHCLADATYHRIHWDISAATHCDIHGVPLSKGSNGKKIGWWWPFLDVSPDGESLLDRSPARPTHPMPFHEMLRTRLTLGRREEGPTSTYALNDIITVTRYFGRFIDGGRPVDPRETTEADVEFGFALTTMPVEERVDWFRSWYETVVPAATRRRGFHASTVANHSQHGRRGNALWDAVEQAQYEAFAQVGTFGRKFAKRQVERGDRTLKEAAESLGVPLKGLRPFIQAMDLLPDAKWNGDAHSIDQATFEKLQALIADLITLPQTKQITGISGTEFRRLTKAGYIREHLHMPIYGVKGPKYLTSDVTALVNRFRKMAKQLPTKRTRGIKAYCEAEGLNPGDLLIAILQGEAKPLAMRPDRTGVLALCFIPG